MKLPKSVAVTNAKPLQASVTTTKRGRRFVICPGCCVIGAPVSVSAERYACTHCGADINLAAKPVRAKREVTP